MSDSLFYGVTVPFLWVLVHTRFVCASQEWSLCFPQSYGGPVIKFHRPSKSDSLGILSTFADPQAGESDVGLRTFTTVWELLWYYCSPVCGSPDKYRIWFYRDYDPFTILLEFLHCPWMWVIFSWWVPVSFCLWLFNNSLWFWCSWFWGFVHLFVWPQPGTLQWKCRVLSTGKPGNSLLYLLYIFSKKYSKTIPIIKGEVINFTSRSSAFGPCLIKLW